MNRGLLLLVVMAVFAAIGVGQSTYATLFGVVTDPSGAIVSGAGVKIVNRGTGAERSLVTGPTGEFAAPNLDPAEYSVTFEKPGFAVVSRGPVTLLARDIVRLDVRLEVAANTHQTVDVIADAGVIQTEVPTIADSKSGRAINELALNFRATDNTSPLAVATLVPGVQKDRDGQISISGMQPYTASTSIDGVSTLSPRLGGPVADLFSFGGGH